MNQKLIINPDELERRMQIAEDTKKVFHRSKCSGKWIWCDRDVSADTQSWSPEFDTYWDALCDATEPYMEDEE